MHTITYEKEQDHLALGLTRSPMFMGVNIRLFFCNLMFSALICLDANTFWGVPLFIILHLFLVKVSMREPNIVYLYVKSFFKTPPVLNQGFWGNTNSYAPW